MTTPALKVLIVDDEPLARMRLRSLLEACTDPRAEVVAEAGSASQAQDAMLGLREPGCDLVLLDIQMPGPDGLHLARTLRDAEGANRPAVVFVTAHAEHALQAFELDAFDYLTKPVRRERLQAALARVAQRLTERAAVQGASAPALEGEDSPFIVVSDRGRMSRVPVTDVLYLKAELKYLTLRTATQSLVLDGSLSEFEQRLGEKFLRVHRNALVAKSAVRELQRHAAISEAAALDADGGDGIDGWAVRIAKVDEWLAVSRRQVAAVREALGAQD